MHWPCQQTCSTFQKRSLYWRVLSVIVYCSCWDLPLTWWWPGRLACVWPSKYAFRALISPVQAERPALWPFSALSNKSALGACRALMLNGASRCYSPTKDEMKHTQQSFTFPQTFMALMSTMESVLFGSLGCRERLARLKSIHCPSSSLWEMSYSTCSNRTSALFIFLKSHWRWGWDLTLLKQTSRVPSRCRCFSCKIKKTKLLCVF